MMLRAPVSPGSTDCRLITQRAWRAAAGIVLLVALTPPGMAAAQGPLPQKTLAECVAIALEHHPTLKAASATIDAAHQRVWQAASSYLPQVGVNATRVYEQQSASSAIGVPVAVPAATPVRVGSRLQRFYFNTAAV